MEKFDIVLTNNTLFIKFEGIISYRTIMNVRKKIEYILYEYNVRGIVFDIDDCLNVDDRALIDLINEYSRKGINDLSVIGNF